jgi:hypothetical protein
MERALLAVDGPQDVFLLLSYYVSASMLPREIFGNRRFSRFSSAGKSLPGLPILHQPPN